MNVGGSFIGSTAHSIQFSDGKEFNAFNPQIETKALLSINLPTALQFSTNPSSIIVQGNGHLKDIDSNTFAVLDLIGDTLNVPKGKTLALIGGELRLQGGNLQAEAGRRGSEA